MAGSNSHITILTLNINGLNAPIKRHRLANWIKMSRPISVLYLGNPSHVQRHVQTQNKGMEEDLPRKQRTKKAGVAILVSDKMDFKPIKVKKDKEGHYITVKWSIQQEELTILNIYASKTGAPRYIKQVLNNLKGDLHSHPIIVGDFNTSLSILDKWRQKINKDIKDFNAELDQVDLTDIYRMLHPKSTEYTLFSAPHCTYYKIDHIIGSKSLLSKCKRTEIITNSLSDHSTIRSHIRIKKLTQICTTMWKLNNLLLVWTG